MFHRSLGVREQGHPTGSHANPFSTHTRAHTLTDAHTHTLNSRADKKKDRETDRQARREPCRDSSRERDGWTGKPLARQTNRQINLKT